MKTYAILLASGVGARVGGELPKQFIKILGKTILEHSIAAFDSHQMIDAIVLVVHPNYRAMSEEIVTSAGFKKIVSIINGGKERKDSSYNGILEVARIEKGEECNILIHDVARPCVKSDIITASINSLELYSASVPVIELSDTALMLKKSGEDLLIGSLLNRSSLRLVQTPQAFKFSIIRRAYELTYKDTIFTDDASLVVQYNLCEVLLIKGDIENIKITYPRDILLAENYFNNSV